MNINPISRRVAVALLALAATAAAPAHAEGTDIVAASQSEVQLYKGPSIADAGAKIPAKDFPWKVMQKSKGFYEIKTATGSAWVNSMDVRTAPAAAVVCSTPPAIAHVAGSRNAGSARCN
ncbi:hypothetical protein AWB77_01804 [Caballeronia fortuita]|uniref:SH3 domain-containing protein n=1 Tax=Caballeronia fortuita TaxID=1777138 RepID=A0A158AHE0_9BURK|nr:hypothetical protein [Caballeronia fortuita]SAK57228.1 hypothetical protein AWB77_01804 [Caballeronia fortuita]